MLRIYSAIFYLLLPLIVARLFWRSLKAPDYRKRIGERLGLYDNRQGFVDVWFHAVSVGEAEALLPLVRRIRQRSPGAKILITTTTPTGSARIKKALADTIQHVYLPYDLPYIVDRFLDRFKPKLAVVMETELWPNLFKACAGRAIPLYIVNARLSEKSLRGYRKIPFLVRPTLSCITLILAQSQMDANRFLEIGANSSQVLMTGNIKFDIELEPSVTEQATNFRVELFPNRFVWIIASTHQGEEDIFLKIYRTLKGDIPDLLLLIVPRHPERFGEVEEICRRHGFEVVTRTSGLSCPVSTDVFILNKMGELKTFYAASDLAFVGGSMVPVGGHNILEPAALGVPILFGPYMDNFKDIERKVLVSHAAIQCPDEQAIIGAVRRLWANPNERHILAKNALSFIEFNRGVLDRILDTLSSTLSALKSD
ncbi:MAG: lipid IV(A) 3-deoxy-D-manno-octulosonic acid transferase [Gammaproteobacteria bacterium]